MTVPKHSSFLKYKKLDSNAVLSRSSPLSTNYDLYSTVETVVPARGKALIPTGLSIAVPDGTFALIESRLDLEQNHSITVGAGVVDSDYRGPVGVVLFNHSCTDFDVKVGDCVAEMIIIKIRTPKVEDWDRTEMSEGLTETLRIKGHSSNAVLPSRGSPLSAGYDLSSAVEAVVPARGKAVIPIDLSIFAPKGTIARIAPRSGLAWKHSIDIGDSLTDPNSHQPIQILLFNYSDMDFHVKPGDRVAQLVLEMIMTPDELDFEKLVKKNSCNAILNSCSSVGYRLFSAVEAVVPACGTMLISTDVSISVPEGIYARIECISRLAWNHSIKVGHVGIEAGSVVVLLHNFSDTDFNVKHGDLIAQIVMKLVISPDPIEVDDLDETKRGEGGFGSTGVKSEL